MDSSASSAGRLSGPVSLSTGPFARRGGTARRLLARTALSLSLATLIGFSYAGQFYYMSAKAGRPMPFAQALEWTLADWYVFALLAIPAIYLAERFTFAARRWVLTFAIHLGLSLLFSLAYMAVRAFVGQWQNVGGVSGNSFGDAFQQLFKTFHFNLWIYWIVVSLTQVVTFYRELHQRELRTRELETGLTQARLQALQMQLNPHFLFNTLHTISALMHKDVNAADDMISHLSLLLRQALENTGSHEVPLRDELAFLKKYLHIEQTRFGERLAIHWNIDEATLDARVPNLLLQPIVENAIRHGIEPHARAGHIDLEAVRQDGRLEIKVRDNGSGLAPGARIDEGVGLSNTRARLEQLYGAEHRFEYVNAPRGGLEVQVSLPYRATDPIKP